MLRQTTDMALLMGTLQAAAGQKQMSFMSGHAPSQEGPAARDNTELELEEVEEDDLSPLEKELQQTEQIRSVPPPPSSPLSPQQFAISSHAPPPPHTHPTFCYL